MCGEVGIGSPEPIRTIEEHFDTTTLQGIVNLEGVVESHSLPEAHIRGHRLNDSH
jgi:hypothetical protein